MSLLSFHELCDLVTNGVISPVVPDDINGTSIDVHLGHLILAEVPSSRQPVSLHDKESIALREIDITGMYYDLRPGEFVLAHTIEQFNLPDDISAEFKLNSSGARIGLENALATWCDPRWHSSVLTLELKNLTQYHTIRLHHGVRIGQMIFHRSDIPVPEHRSYAVRGRYNGDKAVSGVKKC